MLRSTLLGHNVDALGSKSGATAVVGYTAYWPSYCRVDEILSIRWCVRHYLPQLIAFVRACLSCVTFLRQSWYYTVNWKKRTRMFLSYL